MIKSRDEDQPRINLIFVKMGRINFPWPQLTRQQHVPDSESWLKEICPIGRAASVMKFENQPLFSVCCNESQPNLVI